jgi:hypothetical protein
MTVQEVRGLLPGWEIGVQPVRDLTPGSNRMLWCAVRLGRSRKQFYALSPEDLIKRCRSLDKKKA